jgi:hypothetical protein
MESRQVREWLDRQLQSRRDVQALVVFHLACLAVAAWHMLAPPLLRAEENASVSAESPAPGLVMIESTRVGAVVERRANHIKGWSLTLPFPAYTTSEQWEPVCVVPCAQHLDRNAVYKIDGIGVAPSSSFVLPRGPDPLKLRVKAASKIAHDTGVGATVIGVISIIIAGTVAAGASSTKQAESTLLFVGAPGLAVTTIGAVLWGVNGSSVRTSDGRSL